MIDPKDLRDHPEKVATSLKNRGCPSDMFPTLQQLDKEWRTTQQTLEQLQETKNKTVPKGKPTDAQRETLTQLSQDIKTAQDAVTQTKQALDTFADSVPNILQDDVPIGTDETENIVVRTEGSLPKLDFDPKSHDTLATDLNIIDFDQATTITGSRFAIFKGLGAKLERAIATFMLDTHTEQFNYKEISPPVIVNSASMRGTGQLPKFKDDLYAVDEDYWLSPTAEVQLTNLHQNNIIPESELPLRYCAFTPCFRKEAGSYGKDMKGIIRLHQFNKVELVQFVTPETSNAYLMELLSHAEAILKTLELPYRVVQLCSGDTGFSASKTYDLEVWFPSQNAYREISSCSNFLNFQARRSKIRYRDQNKNVEYVHTLNGSGLAVGRTLAAILENYQDKSGIIKIPKVLQANMGIQEIGYEKELH